MGAPGHRSSRGSSRFFVSPELSSGTAYFVAFGACSLLAAASEDLDPVATLLFAEIPPRVLEAFAQDYAPQLSVRDHGPFVFAVVALLGAMQIAVSPFLSVRAQLHMSAETGDEAFSVFLNAMGFAFAFYAVDLLSDALGVRDSKLAWGYLGYLQGMYFYLAFLLMSAARFAVPFKHLLPQSYDILFDGAFAILFISLIEVFYGTDTAGLLSSTAFFFMTVLGVMLLEITAFRFMFSSLITMSNAESAGEIETLRRKGLLRAFGILLIRAGRTYRSSRNVRAEFFAIARAHEAIEGRPQEYDPEEVEFLAGILTWIWFPAPLATALAYNYIIAPIL